MLAIRIIWENSSGIIDWVEVCLPVVPIVVLCGLHIHFILLLVTVRVSLHVTWVFHEILHFFLSFDFLLNL